MSRLTKQNIFYGLLFFIGFLTRLFIIIYLPIWHDEAYSIWASQTQLNRILLGFTDPVHTPGYYILLKIWGLPTIHLLWMRMLGLLLSMLNTWLLFKLGASYKNKNFGYILALVYTLSGYFLMFDWQVRMYTGVITFILLSLITLPKIHTPKGLILFTCINFLGLYFDYGFLWYLFPLFCIYALKYVQNSTTTHFKLAISVVISTLLFFCAYPAIFYNFSKGVTGIDWMANYLSPLFFIPYFLGSPSNLVGAIGIGALCIAGIITMNKQKQVNNFSTIIFFTSCISLILTLSLSYIYKPLFHVRSLQIVGLAVTFGVAELLHHLYIQKKYIYIISIFFLVTANCLYTARMITHTPNVALVSPIYWRELISTYTWNASDYIYYEVQPDTPTYLLQWSLEYTVNGYDTLPMKQIPFYTDKPKLITPSCTRINEQYIIVYKCTKS